MNRVLLFDMLFENVTLVQATEQIVALANSGAKGALVVTPNVDHIVTMRYDIAMRNVFLRATLRFADGMPIVWLSRAVYRRGLVSRVTGADLLPSIASAAAQQGLRIFLLGGGPGVADAAAARLVADSPGLLVAGTYCPPFGFEHDLQQCQEIARMINDSAADVLFVGVGTPKQEKWLDRWIGECGASVGIGVGAAFDFVAGTSRRAPAIIQRFGFEWLWRLGHEPRRLFRRYVIKDSVFLLLAVQEVVRRRRAR